MWWRIYSQAEMEQSPWTSRVDPCSKRYYVAECQSAFGQVVVGENILPLECEGKVIIGKGKTTPLFVRTEWVEEGRHSDFLIYA